ncbi:MAG: DUF4214 domain-containing protein, partial [Pseudomonadota bacterium]
MVVTSAEITKSFQAVLFRQPTQAELTSFATTSNADLLVSNLMGSSEAQNVIHPLLRLYQSAFNRVPDASGMEYWANEFRTGRDLLALATRFLDTPESSARGVGATNGNQEFVSNVYRNSLNRTPDQEGLGFWQGLLDQGRTRSDIISEISRSAEAQALAAPGIANIAQGLQRDSLDLERLSEQNVSLYNLRADTTDQVLQDQNINNLFSSVLQRSPSALELQIARTQDQSALVQQVARSQETQTYIDPMVGLYQTVYGRVPDENGMNYWVNELRGGR